MMAKNLTGPSVFSMLDFMQQEKQPYHKGRVFREHTPVRIALVDDDQSVHQAMHCAFKELARDWRLESYMDGYEALHQICSSPPNAILMDIVMPGISGIECTSKLKVLYPKIPIVMHSARNDSDAVINSMMAGACGYLTKPVSAVKILLALKKAINGSMVLTQIAEKAMLDGLHSLGRNTAATRLSHREQEIMKCVCHRQSNKEIAENLGISSATVHAHLSRIFKKLGAHSRTEAIRRYLGEGLENSDAVGKINAF
jgi:DNA-binding NarL/FixJ family response regulator